ncbi:GNAT family N-acetyltransferase [Komagataeibacter rhaeticus]|nr:GNAT family N-acetyltransferase [Komagataeibacter rhaeticus]
MPATPFPALFTPRLRLEPLTLADAPAIQVLFPQWEIVRFLAPRVPWPYGPDDAENSYATWPCPPWRGGGVALVHPPPQRAGRADGRDFTDG